MFVPMYDWQAFLSFSKSVKSIKQYHHSHQAMGVVMATTHAEGPTQILPVLVEDAGAVPHAPPPSTSLLSSQPNANGTSSLTSMTSAQTTPRTQCAPNPQRLSLAPHYQDTVKNHFLRVSQYLKVVVMPLPEAGVVVGAGVVVVVLAGAEDRGEDGGEGRCTKGIRLRLRLIIYTGGGGGGGGGGDGESNGLSITIPVPAPITSPITKDIKDTKVMVMAVQGDVRPPDRLCYCDYYYLLLPLLHFNLS